MSAGRELDLHLDLLDRQIEDCDGRLCGKVDDVDLEVDASGNAFITALLVGPIALAPRFGRRMGRWLADLARHTAGDLDRPPFRVDISHVTDMASAIRLDASRSALGLGQGDDWVADKIIGRLPGATHASE